MVKVKVALAIALIALACLSVIAALAAFEDAIDIALQDCYEELANYGPEDETPITLTLQVKVLEVLEALSDFSLSLIPL